MSHSTFKFQLRDGHRRLNKAYKVKLSTRTAVESVLNHKAAPYALFADLKLVSAEDRISFAVSLISGIKTLEKKEDLSKVVSFLSSVMRGLELPLQARSEVINDLGDLKQKLSAKYESGGQKPQIIATVYNNDPKFLLTIGDAVNSNSCQNYKTGGMIQTLPGYVADANVPAAIVSYALDASQFKTPHDFNQAMLWVAQEQAKVEFDGNKVTFRISYQNPTTKRVEVVESLAVGQGYLRNIIKYGATVSNQPGLFAERDYAQTHPHSGQMKSQHQQLFDQIKTELGATTIGSITVHKSRNPGGHYSDASGGTKIETYVIKRP